MADDFYLKKEIIDTGKRLYDKNFVAANDGNISVRVDGRYILTTPTGVSKGYMHARDIALVDYDGNLIEGEKKPSSELKMHLLIYKLRRDINAVVHAHPPYSTAFACAGKPLNKPIIAEAVITVGDIALAPYSTPGTHSLTDILKPFIMNHDAILMANHGVVTYAANLERAFFQMETVEHYAHICHLTEPLGQGSMLSKEEIQRLKEIRAKNLDQE